MQRHLILFDCDGTLIDSQHDIVTAMDHAFTSQGLTPPSRAATLSVIGLSVPEAIRSLAPDAPDIVQRLLADDFRTGAPAQRVEGGRVNPLYPGALALIAALASRDDIVLGVATGKSRRGVERLFGQHGWHPHFATVQTADTNRSKPDPDMIHTAMVETGVDAQHTLMIGDTSFDMAMARAAAVTAVGVTWGYHAHSGIVEAGAHKVVHTFDELHAAIDFFVAGRKQPSSET